jgi:hypothetical protein
LALLSLTLGSAWASLPAPEFETYPVHQIYIGKVAPLRLTTERQKFFADALNTASLGPANFSGHYRIVHLACGDNCHQVAIIDLRSGDVSIPSFTLTNSAGGEMSSRKVMEYRPDSELLILYGSLGHGTLGSASGGLTHYFRWDGRTLQALSR